METKRKIAAEDFWTPPENGHSSFKPTGNDIIDRFAREVRIRKIDMMSNYAKSLGITLSELNEAVTACTIYSQPTLLKDHIMSCDAQWYLEHTELTIREISDILGFASYEYFCKFFRRMKLMAPSKYRKIKCAAIKK